MLTPNHDLLSLKAKYSHLTTGLGTSISTILYIDQNPFKQSLLLLVCDYEIFAGIESINHFYTANISIN